MTNRRLLLSLIGAGAVMGLKRVAAAAAASPRDLADQFAATLNAHDIDGFGALFAEDYVNHQNSAAAPPRPRASRANRVQSCSLPPG
jgi:hypothetical protein